MSAPELEQIRDFLLLSDSVATAGQPTEEQFAAIKGAGYEVVVNLALNDSSNALPDERKVVQDLGLEYVHIPVQWDTPQVADAQKFFQVMQSHRDRKIFVHCAANKRVSAFMYLYRTICDGMSREDAVQDLHRLWEPNDTWQEFMAEVPQQIQR